MNRIHQRGVLASTPLISRHAFRKLIVQVRDIHLDAMVFHSMFLDPRTERIEAMCQVDIITFDNREVRHGLSRYGLTFALGPIPYLRLRYLIGRYGIGPRANVSPY